MAELPTTRLGEITVTARYGHESAQKVPIAITSLSSDQLKALNGTFNLKQLMSQLPSVNIQGFSGRNQTLTIRGIGTNAGGTNDGLEQGVGLYIDGVYRPRTGTAITDLIDVESVQLLRGPQGTLFGKNTVAGAIDIRTIEPKFERAVAADLTYGNYNFFKAALSFTNPVSDSLTFRVSYVRTTRDGIIDNIRFKQPWDNMDNHSFRADILYKPSATFKSRLIIDYSLQQGHMGFQVVAGVLPTVKANGSVVKGYYERAADVGYKALTPDPFARKVDLDSSQWDRMPSWGIQNRADVKLAENLNLTSISAYRKWEWLPNYDGDQIGANVSTLGVVETHQQQVSQEVRLTGSWEKKLDYTAGLYFFWQEANDYQHSVYGKDASKWLLGPATSPEVLNRLDAASHVVPSTFSYAAFGQATAHLGERVHLTGGLRATLERRHGSYDAAPQGNLTPIEELPVADQAKAEAQRASYGPTGKYDESYTNRNLSGTVNLAVDVLQNLHAYAAYSRGYKSSGMNLVRQSLGVNIFVKPERIDDVELGFKSRFLDGRLEVNPNVFWLRDHNYQANFVNTNVSPAVQYITNVGVLGSKGVELDLRLLPVNGFSASASVMYNDAKYLDYKNASAQYFTSHLVTQDLSGRRASGAPLWTAGATAQYFKAISRGNGREVEAYVGGDWSIKTAFYATVNLDPYGRVPRHQLFGLHLGTRDDQGRWDVSLWVRNLLDKGYYNTLSVNATYGVVLAALGDPRTFGLTVRAKF